MTTDVLTRALALVDAITPGEWRVETDIIENGEYAPDTYPWSVYAPDPYRTICQFAAPWPTDSDAAFIAAAPALVRDLLAACEARDAEIARLRAKVEDLEEGNWPFEWTVATAEREKRKAAEACMKMMQNQLARIADLERVLRSLTDDVPGAGFRNCCAYCGADLTGHLKEHDDACPVARARKLLTETGDDHE